MKICLGANLAEALELSSSGMAVVVPSWLGRNSASSMNCPDCMLLLNFSGMGEEICQLRLFEVGGKNLYMLVSSQLELMRGWYKGLNFSLIFSNRVTHSWLSY